MLGRSRPGTGGDGTTYGGHAMRRSDVTGDDYVIRVTAVVGGREVILAGARGVITYRTYQCGERTMTSTVVTREDDDMPTTEGITQRTIDVLSRQASRAISDAMRRAPKN